MNRPNYHNAGGGWHVPAHLKSRPPAATYRSPGLPVASHRRTLTPTPSSYRPGNPVIRLLGTMFRLGFWMFVLTTVLVVVIAVAQSASA